MLGGAMYAWQRGFTKNGKVPWYARVGAVAFALFAAIAAIGTGSAVQASAMTGIMTSSGLQVEPWIIGIVIVVLVAAVIFGGVKIISDVCERLVPVMAIGYALGCVIILALNWAYLWDALVLIFECAFTAKAALRWCQWARASWWRSSSGARAGSSRTSRVLVQHRSSRRQRRRRILLSSRSSR